VLLVVIDIGHCHFDHHFGLALVNYIWNCYFSLPLGIVIGVCHRASILKFVIWDLCPMEEFGNNCRVDIGQWSTSIFLLEVEATSQPKTDMVGGNEGT